MFPFALSLVAVAAFTGCSSSEATNFEENRVKLSNANYIYANALANTNGLVLSETEGYTTEDFFRLLTERIQAEQRVLADLNNDPNPDLYAYCLNLYQERERHPVVY